MRKLVFCLVAVLTLVTFGCKKNEIKPTHFQIESDVQVLEGHETCGHEIAFDNDFDVVRNKIDQISADVSNKNREELILQEMRTLASNHSNGLLYGKLILREVNSENVIVKEQSVEVTLAQNTYKYVSGALVGEDSDSFKSILNRIVESLDNKPNLTDAEVISPIDTLVASYSDKYLSGNLVVSKSNDSGKTFTEVKKWGFEPGMHYRVKNEAGSITGFRRIVAPYRAIVARIEGMNFASAEEATQFVKDSICAVYNNRCLKGKCTLLSSTDGFATSTVLFESQLERRPIMRGFRINDGDGDISNLREALYDKMLEMEGNGLCYAEESTEMVEVMKEVCRQYPDARGTLQIVVVRNDSDPQVELEIVLPVI